MSYLTHPYSTPIQELYFHAMETNNAPILEEFDMDRVYSIFKDFIAQNPELDFVPNTKFGPVLLVSTLSPDVEVDLTLLQFHNGFELCDCLLDAMVRDIYSSILKPFRTTESFNNYDHPCSDAHEQIIREKVTPIRDQFPLTKELLFDSIMNYPNRLTA